MLAPGTPGGLSETVPPARRAPVFSRLENMRTDQAGEGFSSMRHTSGRDSGVRVTWGLPSRPRTHAVTISQPG